MILNLDIFVAETCSQLFWVGGYKFKLVISLTKYHRIIDRLFHLLTAGNSWNMDQKRVQSKTQWYVIHKNTCLRKRLRGLVRNMNQTLCISTMKPLE